uniref:Uncharacterized protein n=1 Tax=Rhizophora mucronata TaxID=61149 RepID=A0A2P2QF21_RHIMU
MFHSQQGIKVHALICEKFIFGFRALQDKPPLVLEI